MKGKVLFITLLLSVLLAGRAEAQRCLPGMKGIQVSAEMADGFYSQRNRKDAGYAFSLALFTYGKGGHKWMYGIGMMKRHYPYRKTRIPLAQYTGEAGYCYNFLSTPGKTVFLNAGLSGLLGYERVNGGKRMLEDGAVLQESESFIYGGFVTFEAEAYLSDCTVLAFRLRERILWGSAAGHFHTQYGIALKYIF